MYPGGQGRHLELRQDGYDEVEEAQSPRGLHQKISGTLARQVEEDPTAQGKLTLGGLATRSCHPADTRCPASGCHDFSVSLQTKSCPTVSFLYCSGHCVPGPQNPLRLPSCGQAEGTTCPRSASPLGAGPRAPNKLIGPMAPAHPGPQASFREGAISEDFL